MRPTPEQIIAAVEAEFSITNLVSEKRMKPYPIARAVAAKVMQDLRRMSTPEIGEALARVHSSIVDALHRSNPLIAAKVENVKRRLATAQKDIRTVERAGNPNSAVAEIINIAIVLKAHGITTAAQLVHRLNNIGMEARP